MVEVEVARVLLGPVEDAMLYTVCPGCLALRLLVPGGGFDCEECWWSQLRSPALVTRRVSGEFLREKRAITRFEVLIIDGPEPLETVDPGTLCSLVEGLGAIVVVRGLGLLDPSVYREASKCVHMFSIDASALVADNKPRGFNRVYDVVADERLNVEVVLPYRRRGLRAIIASLAGRYRRPVVVNPGEGFEDDAYKVVDEMRKKGLLVYLHGDSSFTLLDVTCPSCRAVLVERRPWGVRRHYEPPKSPQRVTCPRCGSLTPLVDLEPAKRPRLQRTVAVL